MMGLRVVATRAALAGFGVGAAALAAYIVIRDGFGADQQMAVAFAAGVLLWCSAWSYTLRAQPSPPQALGILAGLAALLVGLGLAAGDRVYGLVATMVAVAAMGVFVARIGGDRARLRAEIDDAAVEVAGARAAAAAASESEQARHQQQERLLQGLSSIELHARVAARDADQSARRAFELIERTATDHLAEARRVDRVASAPDQSTTPTTVALSRVVERFVRNIDINGELEVRGEPRTVSATVELALIRTLQEAVSNIRRHSRASRFDAILTFDDAAVGLEVVDDGVGIDPSLDPEGGLATTRKRIEVLGGSLAVGPGRHGGTRLAAAIPT